MRLNKPCCSCCCPFSRSLSGRQGWRAFGEFCNLFEIPPMLERPWFFFFFFSNSNDIHNQKTIQQ